MPIDPSISLQTQQYDPVGSYGKAVQLSSLLGQQKLQALQIDQAQREQKDGQTLADLYKGNLNPDGSLNRGAILQSAASQGLGAKIPGLQKQWNEADETAAKLQELKGKIGEHKFKVLRDSTEMAGNAVMSLLSRQQPPTEADVMQTMGTLVSQGAFNVAAELHGTTPDELARQQLADMPRGNPAALRDWLVTKGMRGMEASKQFDMITPKFEMVNNGKQKIPVDMNGYTNPNPLAIRMTTTPGEDQSAATARRGQDIQAQTSRRGQDLENARAGTAIEKDASGNLMLVNKATGASRPITGASGKPINLGMGQADAREALNLINQAEPLLRSSTGSYGGKAIDLLAAGFGVATPGSITAGKLKALEGSLVSKMPKMSGPQSDRDVAMYRQMAGEIGDDTVPYARKLAALETIREIQERHAGMPTGSSKPARPQATAAQPAAKPAALPGGWSVTEH